MKKIYKHITSATLPVSFYGQTKMEIHCFACEDGENEITVLINKDQHASDTPIVRLHSACLTGEAFKSLKCDCGFQLDTAIEKISESHYGILVYLNNHEGRGIGLSNKIKAYALQDKGYNTIEANKQLGLPVDARCFEGAVSVLKYFGVSKVRLMTNNPLKIKALKDLGIMITERIPLICDRNQFNTSYLDVKQKDMGHYYDREKKYENIT